MDIDNYGMEKMNTETKSTPGKEEYKLKTEL